MSKLKYVTEHDGSQWVELEVAEEMYRMLEVALTAIESLDESALGQVEDTPDRQGWFVKDEMIYNIGNLLTRVRGEL